MGILLILVGLILTDVGVRGTSTQFFAQVKQDTFPPDGGGFFTWAILMLLVGSLGFVPSLKTFSAWFMALVIVAMLVSQKNDATKVIQQLTAFIKQPTSIVPGIVTGPTILEGGK
jgi:hypothetical protein